jgi:hypothetical protein
VATAVSGVIYAMFSGQPLTIMGCTGPVVTYTAILYGLAAQMGIPFLTFYAWVGLWSAAILFVCAVTGASNSIKYITRFTDEIFSGLIAVIFIYESIKFLVVQNLCVSRLSHRPSSHQPNWRESIVPGSLRLTTP